MNYIESKTKIIATIGPSSAPKEMLRKMILAGVGVCRLNFSHGTHADHLLVINTVKELRKELDMQIALLADLQGPKIRIGEVENNGVDLIEGHELVITNTACLGTKEKIFLSYTEFARDVKVGDEVLVDDGKIKLEVTATNRLNEVRVKVIYGGILSSRKGVNLPSTAISMPSLTEKDIEDLHFALEHDVDWVALSFVRTVTDIVALREIIKKQKKHSYVIAKIEKPEALLELYNIIDMTDAIMVARGDLGVEVPFDRVPVIQKQIVEQCIRHSKPVIIATQMMESMITNFRPTRAEANDVGNAVLDGADTLMLSGETSTGKFPLEVIEAMHKIIQYTEDNRYNYYRDNPPKDLDRTFVVDSVCYSACRMAEQSKAKAIISFTHSGDTAFRLSGYRPKADIYVFTSNRELICKMALLWGVKAFYFDKYEDIDDAIDYSNRILREKGFIKANDMVIHVGSTPLHEKGRANMLKLTYIQ